MKTGFQNFPELRFSKKPRIAILQSKFNESITGSMKEAAIATLKHYDLSFLDEDLYLAPGAFEIPLLAKKLAHSKKYDGVICLGCVIKGDTAHFEFISMSSSLGIMQTTLETEVPITFGILTTYTKEQADVRSQADFVNTDNKGKEAALACLESISILQKIQ